MKTLIKIPLATFFAKIPQVMYKLSTYIIDLKIYPAKVIQLQQEQVKRKERLTNGDSNRALTKKTYDNISTFKLLLRTKHRVRQ